MNVVVCGTGYVGLVTGICLSSTKNKITCVDIDEDKIDRLNNGIIPIYEVGLEELLAENRQNISFSTDREESYANADIIFIAVGTPEKKDGSANLTYVYDVAKEIASSILKDCIVVVKSTVPIGTNEKVERIIRDNLKSDVKFEVVSNPEFLSQGTAVRDTLNAKRIVLGIKSDWAKNIMIKLYDPFNIPYVITDRKSAEMIKYACNDFLSLKISYINEIANLCESIGANIDDVAKGMGLDPRIGDKFLNAGIGYGGSCFPKDTKALHWLSNLNDVELKTIKAAIEVNENQKIRLIKKSKKYYDTLNGLNVAVLGLTFKPNTDDLREAPSIPNIELMIDDGANIKVWDPVGIENYKKIFPSQINYMENIEATLKDADICFIFTEWQEIKELRPEIFKRLMKNPIVLDGRNCYNVNNFENMGVTYDSIGRVIVR